MIPFYECNAITRDGFNIRLSARGPAPEVGVLQNSSQVAQVVHVAQMRNLRCALCPFSQLLRNLRCAL